MSPASTGLAFCSSMVLPVPPSAITASPATGSRRAVRPLPIMRAVSFRGKSSASWVAAEKVTARRPLSQQGTSATGASGEEVHGAHTATSTAP